MRCLKYQFVLLSFIFWICRNLQKEQQYYKKWNLKNHLMLRSGEEYSFQTWCPVRRVTWMGRKRFLKFIPFHGELSVFLACFTHWTKKLPNKELPKVGGRWRSVWWGRNLTGLHQRSHAHGPSWSEHWTLRTYIINIMTIFAKKKMFTIKCEI